MISKYGVWKSIGFVPSSKGDNPAKLPHISWTRFCSVISNTVSLFIHFLFLHVCVCVHTSLSHFHVCVCVSLSSFWLIFCYCQSLHEVKQHMTTSVPVTTDDNKPVVFKKKKKDIQEQISFLVVWSTVFLLFSDYWILLQKEVHPQHRPLEL